MVRLFWSAGFRGVCISAVALSGGANLGCDAFADEPDTSAFIRMQVEDLQTGVLSDTLCRNVAEEGTFDSASGGGSSDFWRRSFVDAAGMDLRVGSGPEELERRFYGHGFISEHRVDTFEVTTQAGDRYALQVWGADDCQSDPPPRQR